VPIRIDVFHHIVREPDPRLDEILAAVRQLLTQGGHMSQEIDELRAQVERDANVTSSAVTLLNELKTKLDEAIATGDLSAVKALSDQIGANTDALAAAVAMNTPSAPPA
jgi:hypothetical protein